MFNQEITDVDVRMHDQENDLYYLVSFLGSICRMLLLNSSALN